MTEAWKDIPGVVQYQASSLGRVRSLKFGRAKILKLSTRGKGYLAFRAYDDGMRRDYSVHRVVALAFHQNPDNLPFVNHINLIKTDNRPENLEWCSLQQNYDHAYANGRFDRRILMMRGQGHPRSKLTYEKVIAIREDYKNGIGPKALVQKYEVTQKCVDHVVYGHSWKWAK